MTVCTLNTAIYIDLLSLYANKCHMEYEQVDLLLVMHLFLFIETKELCEIDYDFSHVVK